MDTLSVRLYEAETAKQVDDGRNPLRVFDEQSRQRQISPRFEPYLGNAVWLTGYSDRGKHRVGLGSTKDHHNQRHQPCSLTVNLMQRKPYRDSVL